MAQYPYLPLKRLEGQMQRRKPNGFGNAPQREPSQHGPKVAGEISAVLAQHATTPAIAGVDPSLILRIELDGYVDENEWTRLGLTILSEDQDKTLLLFASDKELVEFRRKVEAYQGELPLGQKAPSFAGLINSIRSIGTATAQDRLGQSFLESGISNPTDLVNDTVYIIDIELFHPNDDMQADIFVYRLEQEIAPFGGVIINTYKGDNLLLCRAEVNGAAIQALLALPEVFAIELPPKPDLQTDDLGEVTSGTVSPGSAPLDGSIAIGIIDSGINSGHPLLAYAMRGSLVAHEAWPDADEAGHGTSVASMAAYGDVSARTEDSDFDAPFWIASARVVGANGEFPKEITVPEMMESSIRKLHADFGCRIFNISLGDPKLIYDGGRVGAWATTLDLVSRELDILIVVSSGNQMNLTNIHGEDILKNYPAYLMNADSKILDPATAANALTVGSLAHANGLDVEDAELVGVRSVCDADQPSPFTRSGPGVRGMIKPDLVDYGGTAVWDGPTKTIVSGGKKAAAGVWTFHNKPIERLFRARSGTSFAAPVVAHKAAILLGEYPESTANLLRSMLALSGETPEAATRRLTPLGNNAPLMICGNGVANIDNAMGSDDSRVVFYSEDELAPDCFAVFELPVPQIFQTTKGTREIKVSLAFDPPVRRTRADYLGLTMGWRLLRGADEKAVFDNFRSWETAEGEPPDFPARYVCPTSPGPTLRERGTLQCASFKGARDISVYGDTYYIAVWCRRRWASKDITSQRFALSVELRHSAAISLYNKLTLPLKVPLKA